MTKRTKNGNKTEKKVTRYTYDEVKEPRTPETGHTALMPADEQVVSLPMDNGWSKAIHVGKLPVEDKRPVVLDMDPAADPVLFWAGKRNRRDVPILPLQRNEIVSDSRIAQIVDRAKRAAAEKQAEGVQQTALFADLERTLRESEKAKRVDFYVYEEGWRNKLICGDSLQVMESLLHYEGLRGKVQMIYVDPPYGVSYNSNFQQRVDTTKNDESDQADDVLTIKAFRDTWALGPHSYLSYLAERLFLCRELLSESGSLFLQIAKEHSHHIRNLLDEVFGANNHCSDIVYVKTSGAGSPSGGTTLLPDTFDLVIWYAKNRETAKYRQLYRDKTLGQAGTTQYINVELPGGIEQRLTEEEIADPSRLPQGAKVFAYDNLTSQSAGDTTTFEVNVGGRAFRPGKGGWKTNSVGMERLRSAGRLRPVGSTLMYKRYLDDFAVSPIVDVWTDCLMTGFSEAKVYSVQTSRKVIERCLLMVTDPGDLVCDPTSGSGTTAWCAENYGRRWVACDLSRVAINVSRNRLMSSVFPNFRALPGFGWLRTGLDGLTA